MPASFGCLLWTVERQFANLRLVKPSKSSKMVNSKDKVDFLVQITFFSIWNHFYFMSAVICGRGRDMRTRIPRICDQFRGVNIPHAKFQPFNFSNTGFRTIQSFELIQGFPKWTSKIVIAYVRKLKFCMWIFSPFRNFFFTHTGSVVLSGHSNWNHAILSQKNHGLRFFSIDPINFKKSCLWYLSDPMKFFSPMIFNGITTVKCIIPYSSVLLLFAIKSKLPNLTCNSSQGKYFAHQRLSDFFSTQFFFIKYWFGGNNQI